MKQTIDFFKELIGAGSGASSMRFIAIHSTLVITYIWAFVCIWRREFVDIPDGVIMFAALTIAGKVIQKFPEVTSSNGNDKEEKSCDKCKSKSEDIINIDSSNSNVNN